jgi:hypothetical protein
MKAEKTIKPAINNALPGFPAGSEVIFQYDAVARFAGA